MKSRSIRRNRVTGKPRKWLCRDRADIDSALEEAETLLHFCRLPKPNGTTALDVMPLEVLRGLAKTCRQKLRFFESALMEREPLSESQKRYCEAEAIPLEDFIRRIVGT